MGNNESKYNEVTIKELTEENTRLRRERNEWRDTAEKLQPAADEAHKYAGELNQMMDRLKTTQEKHNDTLRQLDNLRRDEMTLIREQRSRNSAYTERIDILESELKSSKSVVKHLRSIITSDDKSREFNDTITDLKAKYRTDVKSLEDELQSLRASLEDEADEKNEVLQKQLINLQSTKDQLSEVKEKNEVLQKQLISVQLTSDRRIQDMEAVTNNMKAQLSEANEKNEMLQKQLISTQLTSDRRIQDMEAVMNNMKHREERDIREERRLNERTITETRPEKPGPSDTQKMVMEALASKSPRAKSPPRSPRSPRDKAKTYNLQ